MFTKDQVDELYPSFFWSFGGVDPAVRVLLVDPSEAVEFG